jgi:hypothetical protein
VAASLVTFNGSIDVVHIDCLLLHFYNIIGVFAATPISSMTL